MIRAHTIRLDYSWDYTGLGEKAMRKARLMTTITMCFCALVFLLTILDFAALHDIKKDYVSKSILEDLNISPLGTIPDWTSTAGEWRVVTISYCARFLFVVFTMVVLFYLRRGIRSA